MKYLEVNSLSFHFICKWFIDLLEEVEHDANLGKLLNPFCSGLAKQKKVLDVSVTKSLLQRTDIGENTCKILI